MDSVLGAVKRLLRDEEGPTSVEYAVMIMLVFLAVIAVVQYIGQQVGSSMVNSAAEIEYNVIDR